MNEYVEDMIRKGLAQPMKMRGTAVMVFQMLKIFAEYKLYPQTDWEAVIKLDNRRN